MHHVLHRRKAAGRMNGHRGASSGMGGGGMQSRTHTHAGMDAVADTGMGPQTQRPARSRPANPRGMLEELAHRRTVAHACGITTRSMRQASRTLSRGQLNDAHGGGGLRSSDRNRGRRTDGQANGGTGGQLDGQTDGQMDGRAFLATGLAQHRILLQDARAGPRGASHGSFGQRA